ncbi:MAG TPA: nitrite reductase [Persephonella sp.]|uniref:Nitrite reductase (Cytochrome cd1) (Cytochromeoxidase) (Hydroxylamine reductase) n=1 Tax=Persephonella marina (strain DSM 14350 / EX-H1) TaxID=123214 RepID=C0QTT4_PERMH|nr:MULTISPECIES: nitrite reductase [Persephonella]ACO04194.1 nitrite reductase (Cytochrome cd1) (Cytochromeoxidase) (Hydroxylamine reductase) [Persephonella marina EX-H1]HCB70283.1 nitrite reductase [Persephonella sp.]
MKVSRSLTTFLSAATVASFLTVAVTAANAGPPPLTKEEMKKASQIFFDRCAGCHGMLRKGATGPALTPEALKKKGYNTEVLEAFIYNGTPGGMPDWGKQGVLSKSEINLLARFLQHEPPSPPEMSLADMKRSWKVFIPPEKRPKRPQHNLNWKNFFGVILRDVGKVAIVDGDTKKLVNIVDTGFAVHILRSSASGRYMYSIGRDGKATVIDLWLKKPDKVAEVKTCYDARSIDTSKYHGYEDKYAVIGCYWPPSFVVVDGETLEPKKIVSTSSYYYDTQEFVREARVASIVSSHYDPIWVLNIKEAGQVWLVDYSKVDKGTVKIDMIDAERYLHDGGWDLSKRYFLVAANMRNTIVVIDTKDKELEALIKVGTKPHPGRGANIDHPKYGPIWCTGHIGEKRVACIGTDPEGHPEYAWKVVKWFNLPGEGGGNLFIKTHPNSKYLLADRPLNPDPELKRSIFVFDKVTFKLVKTLKIPSKYKNVRAVHEEFNEDGSEFWISVWGKKDYPTAILVYDAKTLKLKKEITGDWVRTPTGKFNVTNTMKDIY